MADRLSATDRSSLAAERGLNVGVISYDGSVFFGISADRDLDPPVESATAALEEAITELEAVT